MADDTGDAELQAHIREFLMALNQRPGELMQKHLAAVKNPDPHDIEDCRRYVRDLRRIYGQGLLDMYGRIASHGRAICELTDEPELSQRVEKMIEVVAADAADVPTVLAGLDDAANEPNPAAMVRLFLAILDAGARGLPRQSQLAELMVDFTTYCLTRFPPADDV